MKKNYLALLLLCFILVDCNNTSTIKQILDDKIIDVCAVLSNDDYFALEDIVQSIDKVIPLQTSDDAIVDVLVDYLVTDEYIYILDKYQGGSVTVFNIKGDFIAHIHKGNGPGELFNARHLFYDYENDRLFVQDFVQLFEYTKTGQYIRSYPIDYKVIKGDIESVQKIHDGFLCAIQTIDFDSKIVKLDTSMSIVCEFKMQHLPQELPKFVIHGFDNNIWITRIIDNNLYQYSKDTIKVKYLSMGKYEFTVKDEYHGPDVFNHFSGLLKTIEEGKYIFYSLPQFCESEDYMSFSLMTKDHYGQDIYYNKRTQQTLKTKHKDGSLLDVVYENRRYMGKGNVFYGFINPDRLLGGEWNWDGHNSNGMLSDNDLVVLKSAKLDDNPIIVIYTLKKEF